MVLRSNLDLADVAIALNDIEAMVQNQRAENERELACRLKP